MEKKYTESSGNVFADLGFKDPEEYRLKADMAIAINKIISNRGWTQQQAATALGTTQNKISQIQRGILKGFSVYKLLTFLTALDKDVRLIIEPSRTHHGAITLQDNSQNSM